MRRPTTWPRSTTPTSDRLATSAGPASTRLVRRRRCSATRSAVASQLKCSERACALAPRSSRRSVSASRSASSCGELGPVVGQEPGDAVEDRLLHPAGAAVGDGRRADAGRLDDRESPALLERGQHVHPGPRELVELLLVVDVAEEDARGPAGRARSRSATRLSCHQPRAEHRAASASGSSSSSRGISSIACSICLWGTSRLSTTRRGVAERRPRLARGHAGQAVVGDLRCRRRGRRARPARSGSPRSPRRSGCRG